MSHIYLDKHIKQLLKQKLIVAHWDELLRLAASLKFGWVTASLLISKLQAFPQRNATPMKNIRGIIYHKDIM